MNTGVTMCNPAPRPGQTIRRNVRHPINGYLGDLIQLPSGAYVISLGGSVMSVPRKWAAKIVAECSDEEVTT